MSSFLLENNYNYLLDGTATPVLPFFLFDQAGEFKINLSKWFKNVQNTGHPLVITQNERPAGVLISPSEYDELVHKKLL